MVTKRNLIATAFLRVSIKMTAAHPGAEITWVLFDIDDGIKDIRFEKGQGDAEDFGIMLNQLTILRGITGIHTQKEQFKIHQTVFLNLLHAFSHEHGVFTA